MRIPVFKVIFYILLVSSLPYAEGEVQGLKQYLYWENGKPRQCDMYGKDGFVIARAHYRHEDGSIEKVERFDRQGNKVEEAKYDAAGKLKAGIDGWAARRWWYDGAILRSQISYDEYGRPFERKHYSDSGKLVLRQFLEKEDADPYEEAAMYLLLGPQNVKYYDPSPPDPDKETIG